MSPKEEKKSNKFQDIKKQLQIFGMQLISGGGAGAVSKTAVAPLERVKVILQVQSMSNVPEEEKYKGMMDAMIRIPKEQGFFSFWRGNGANVIRIIPNAAIKFTMYDRYKNILFPKGEKNYKGTDKIVRKLASGGLSGATTLAITYPMDLARTRMTADTGKQKQYKGMLDCMLKTAKQEGVSGLYKGAGISLAGIVPYLALSFASYDTLNSLLPKDEKSVKSMWYPWAKLGVGCVSGVFSQTITYPTDTVRRRMQMNGVGGREAKYTSTMDCFKKMLKEEGVQSYFKGCTANIIKGAPGSAIQFVAYDYLKGTLLKLTNKNKKE